MTTGGDVAVADVANDRTHTHSHTHVGQRCYFRLMPGEKTDNEKLFPGRRENKLACVVNANETGFLYFRFFSHSFYREDPFLNIWYGTVAVVLLENH